MVVVEAQMTHVHLDLLIMLAALTFAKLLPDLKEAFLDLAFDSRL